MKEFDHHGLSFATSSNGSTTFGTITENQASAMGTIAAPIKLSEGTLGYGKKHISERRQKRLEKLGFHSVESFVEYAAQNFSEIRQGKSREKTNNELVETFLIVKKGTNTAVLFVELDNNQAYFNVNSGGFFNDNYVERRKLLWSGGTHQTQSSGKTADLD